MPPPPPLRQRLRTALDQALRTRDRSAIAVLRSTVGAIDNAEAVDTIAPAVADSAVVAGAVNGLGAAERPRRALSEDDVAAILEAEIAEQLEAAAIYEAAGQAERAEALRSGAAVLRTVITDPATELR